MRPPSIRPGRVVETMTPTPGASSSPFRTPTISPTFMAIRPIQRCRSMSAAITSSRWLPWSRRLRPNIHSTGAISIGKRYHRACSSARCRRGGGTVTVGNMTWTVKPDVYLAGLAAVSKQIDAGLLSKPAVPYVTNVLTIMVPKGNPAHVASLADLGRSDVKLAMPNPEFEGIARQIKESLAKAGGDALVTTVYQTKVNDGTTELTNIHHRQTPLWLMQGKVQAGVTWQSEAMFQEQAGHPVEAVDIPAAQNTTAIYAAAAVKGAPHPEAASRWLDFIHSPEALEIFERYGFKAYTGAEN